MVDLGGGNGHIVFPIAKTYPSLKFIVQELPGALEKGKQIVSEDAYLKDRIEFMAHDVRNEQPVRDVAAYFMCQCITNWPDKDLAAIFQQLIPALKPGSRLLIGDRKERFLGADSDVDVLEHCRVDMIVLANTNGRVRRSDEIAEVLKMADTRFKLRALHVKES